MPPKINLTIDCADPAVVAGFWKLALGYEDQPAPAPFRTRGEWLASYGVPPEEWADGAWLHDPTGVGPPLSFQRVTEPKVVKNRVHVDVHAADADTAERRWDQITDLADRLRAAGGTVLARHPGHHVVLADPEGNELCVC